MIFLFSKFVNLKHKRLGGPNFDAVKLLFWGVSVKKFGGIGLTFWWESGFSFFENCSHSKNHGDMSPWNESGSFNAKFNKHVFDGDPSRSREVILQDLARWRLSCKILQDGGYLARILEEGGYLARILQDNHPKISVEKDKK